MRAYVLMLICYVDTNATPTAVSHCIRGFMRMEPYFGTAVFGSYQTSTPWYDRPFVCHPHPPHNRSHFSISLALLSLRAFAVAVPCSLFLISALAPSLSISLSFFLILSTFFSLPHFAVLWHFAPPTVIICKLYGLGGVSGNTVP